MCYFSSSPPIVKGKRGGGDKNIGSVGLGGELESNKWI